MNESCAQLEAMRAKANEQQEAREHYAAFLVQARDCGGWTADEMADYKTKIGVLMGKDDAAALALFPAGLYPTAEAARQGARDCWRSCGEITRQSKKKV